MDGTGREREVLSRVARPFDRQRPRRPTMEAMSERLPAATKAQWVSGAGSGGPGSWVGRVPEEATGDAYVLR